MTNNDRRKGAAFIPDTEDIRVFCRERYKAILNEIRLEIGVMGAWMPTHNVEISPYAATYYPQVFAKAKTTILTTTAERSFWEKATILHQEAHRPEGSLVPSRYSRHYYDVYCMYNSPVKEKAKKTRNCSTKLLHSK